MTPALSALPAASLGKPLEAVPGTAVPLVGFSGAHVLLLRDPSGRAFVRKTAGAQDQNTRLHAQALKQQEMGRLLTGTAETPEVLADGSADGLYFFDMEYVRGLDGISFLRRASFASIAQLTRNLGTVLEALSGMTEGPAKSLKLGQVVRDKCRAVSAAIAPIDPDAARAVDALSGALAPWDPAPFTPTANHGDMTLENLVVTPDGRVVLLDLLDTYLDHWLTDVSKLGQDLHGGWYLRHHPPLALGVIHYVRRELMGIARRLAGADIDLTVTVLIAANLVRILPYAKQADERRFVCERLGYFTARVAEGLGSPAPSLEKSS